MPVELQHLRIRRYMKASNEAAHGYYRYDEAADVYIDFNYTGTERFPGLMRLGEAVAQHKYQAIFTDFSGDISAMPSSRECNILRIQGVLQRLPTRWIDVSTDPLHVLEQQLSKHLPRYSEEVVSQLDAGHDLACFFPGLAASVVRAAFFSARMHSGAPEDVGRTIAALQSDSPYAGGRTPFIHQELMDYYVRRQCEDEERNREQRRASGETTYRLQPEGKPLLIDEISCLEVACSVEELAAAEKCLTSVGFTKVIEGTVVSFERSHRELRLFADPRSAKGIRIFAFAVGKSKGRQKQVSWTSLTPSGVKLNRAWWKQGNAEVRVLELLDKQLGRSPI